MEREQTTITPTEAGQQIKRGQAFVERCLREGTFPVGFAEFSKESGRWSYTIPRKAFFDWMDHYKKTIPVSLFDGWLCKDVYIIPQDELRQMLLGRVEVTA